MQDGNAGTVDRAGDGATKPRSGRLAVLSIAVVWLVCVLMWGQPGVTRPDGVGYIAYLPSMWLDHDLLFYDEWERFGLIQEGLTLFKSATANGHLGNHWTIGPALAWFPAFLAADAARTAVPVLERFPRDGIVLPYNVAVLATSAFLGLMTILTGFRITCRLYSPWAAAAASIAVWLGTPLLWYSVRDAAMSHAVASFSCALVVLLSMRLRDGVAREAVFSVGLALGFASMVRIQAAAFVVVPFMTLSPDLRRTLYRQLPAFIAGGLLGTLPELAVSTVLYGHPLGFANIGVHAIGWHPWSKVWLVETLFSWYHGLFSWAPVAAAGVVGLVLLGRTDRRLSTAALFSLVVQWIANSTADRAFWASMSFGPRRFDVCAIFFLIGAAALIDRVPRLATIALGLCCSWTMALFLAGRQLDLLQYQTFPEIIDAVSRQGDRAALLLRFVPPGARLLFAALLLLGLATNVGIVALLTRARPAVRAGIAALYFAAATAFAAWCGANGAARLDEYRILAERSRRFTSIAGHDDPNLYQQEIRYLRKAGRNSEADETEREWRDAVTRHRAARRALGLSQE